MARDNEKAEFDATVYGLMKVPKERIRKPRKYVNKGKPKRKRVTSSRRRKMKTKKTKG